MNNQDGGNTNFKNASVPIKCIVNVTSVNFFNLKFNFFYTILQIMHNYMMIYELIHTKLTNTIQLDLIVQESNLIIISFTYITSKNI